MKRNHKFLSLIGIMVFAVVVCLGFSSAASANEDLTANIGVVAKHQTEQISNKDVVLAGEETTEFSDDSVVLVAKVSNFERAPIGQGPVVAYLEPFKKEFEYAYTPQLSRSVKASGPELLGAVDMFLKLSGIDGESSDSAISSGSVFLF